MKSTSSRKPAWPKHISFGNVTVTIYKRITPNGNKGFMLAYKEDGKDGQRGKRKFDSFSDEAEAILEAEKKARQLSTLGVKAAQLTDEELRDCVTATDWKASCPTRSASGSLMNKSLHVSKPEILTAA